jgi:hypothetical protein
MTVGEDEHSRWPAVWVHVLLGVPAMLPLFWLTSLDWSDYCFVGTVALGWACLLWRDRALPIRAVAGVPVHGLVLALALIWVIHQQEGPGPGIATVPLADTWFPDWLPMLAVAGAFALSVWGAWGGFLWGRLDGLVLGVGIVVAGITGTWALLGDRAMPWLTLVRISASAMMWFAVVRANRSHPSTSRLLAGFVLAVLALVAVTGGVRVGGIYYHESRGQAARSEGAFEIAAEHLRQAHDLSSRLRLEGSRKTMAYKWAGALDAGGKADEAARVLSLAKGFVLHVPAGSWDGPEGGNLFTNHSCWKDVDLLPGEGEIRIYAKGTEALGEWPQMRVTLGGERLGLIFVTSNQYSPYAFHVGVEDRGNQRLEISFLNDYFQATPYVDRSLWIDRAEIAFHEIRWE